MTTYRRASLLFVVFAGCDHDGARDPRLHRALQAYAPGVTLGMHAHALKTRYDLQPWKYFGYQDRAFRTRDDFESLSIRIEPRPRAGGEPLVSARVSAVYLHGRSDSGGVRAKDRLASMLGPPVMRCQFPVGSDVMDVGPIDVYYWPRQDNRAAMLLLPVFPEPRRENETISLMFFSVMDSTEITPLAPGPCLRDGRAPSPQRESDKRAA